MQSAGLSEEVSKRVESNYHKLYHVSDTWIDGILNQAHTDGYILGAFGIKIRTPILAKTPLGSNRLPYPATAERRSAGNAKTQSYGLLNNRAAVEFMSRVHASPYRYDILPSALIHDAIYCLAKDRPDVVKWVNDNLIDCMRWQELPELQHDVVKLSAQLDVFFPDWGHAMTLKNGISKAEIRAAAKAHIDKLKEPKQ